MMNTIFFYTHRYCKGGQKSLISLFYSSKTQKYLGCQEVQAAVRIAVGAAALRNAFGVRLGFHAALRIQYRRFWCKLGQLG